jgi:hypothetical protein
MIRIPATMSVHIRKPDYMDRDTRAKIIELFLSVDESIALVVNVSWAPTFSIANVYTSWTCMRTTRRYTCLVERVWRSMIVTEGEFLL